MVSWSNDLTQTTSKEGLMNPIEREIRKIDRLQQHSTHLGFFFGVIKKFGDDQGGNLAGLITFFGFTSMFPLLLLVVTLIGLILGNHAGLTNQIIHSAASQIPVLGSQLSNNIHALNRKSPAALAIGIIGLLLGSQGSSQTGQYAMAQVWNIPMTKRPNYLLRLKKTAALFFLLGIFFLLGSILSGFSSIASKYLLLRVVALALSLVINIALFLSAFRVLTPKSIPTKNFYPGSIVAGIAWTIVQLLGGYLVGHSLKHASQVYGFFAIVLGILSWIYLGARILIYSAEINVVWARRLWPRSIVQPPYTKADREVLIALGKEQDRSAEEHVEVEFTPNANKGKSPTNDKDDPNLLQPKSQDTKPDT